jgi:hypothetical protein
MEFGIIFVLFFVPSTIIIAKALCDAPNLVSRSSDGRTKKRSR